MSPEFQTGAVIAIILVALAAMIRRGVRSSSAGCGGGCDCAAKPAPPNRRR